jgi:Zn-dependent M16 (insulinase) family peptidase
MGDMLTQANLNDRTRCVEMLKETASRLSSSIAGNGHSYVLPIGPQL